MNHSQPIIIVNDMMVTGWLHTVLGRCLVVVPGCPTVQEDSHHNSQFYRGPNHRVDCFGAWPKLYISSFLARGHIAFLVIRWLYVILGRWWVLYQSGSLAGDIAIFTDSWWWVACHSWLFVDGISHFVIERLLVLYQSITFYIGILCSSRWYIGYNQSFLYQINRWLVHYQ